MAKKRKPRIKKTDADPSNECVSKWISELSHAHPDWPRDQVIAVAFAKCRRGDSQASLDSVEGDQLILKNQMIANEGVLDYETGPEAKKWEDLQMNIGRVAPIIDGHPDPGNGNQGLYSGKENIQGYAFIKACKEAKRLCADMLLFDGAANRSGYSIGFPYIEQKETGEIDGKAYETVQSKLIVDHVALTDYPRNEKALKRLAGDAKYTYHPVHPAITGDSALNSTDINITAVAYDSFRFSQTTVKADQVMTLRDIVAALQTSNPDASEEEIIGHAVKIKENQEKLSGDSNMVIKSKPRASRSDMEEEEDQEEEEETEGDMEKEKTMDSVDALKRELDAVKRKLKERSEKDALEAEIEALKARIAAKDSIINGYQKNEADALRSEVIRQVGGDEKVIDQAMDDYEIDSTEEMAFLKGVHWSRANLVQSPPARGKPVTRDSLASSKFKNITKKRVASQDGKSQEPALNQYNRRWNPNSKKYDSLESWDGL